MLNQPECVPSSSFLLLSLSLSLSLFRPEVALKSSCMYGIYGSAVSSLSEEKDISRHIPWAPNTPKMPAANVLLVYLLESSQGRIN